jgi:prepilin-type N-terminal cleavage/methylation domain-containing protein
MKKNNNSHGFTLVELSIVLLIIGLIIGGITAGSSLINQAKLRAVMSEFNQYQTAINTFKITYMSLPGDFSTASTIWPNCNQTNNYALGINTCNGNSDGMVWYSTGGAGYGDAFEGLQAWQHLSLAGLIPGSYNAVSTGVNHGSTPGLNCPTSKYGANTGWSFSNMVNTYGQPGNLVATQGNYMYFGQYNSNNPTDIQILAGVDAYSIDIKMDDGIPITGKVGATDNLANICVAASKYNLTTSGPLCTMMFFYN